MLWLTLINFEVMEVFFDILGVLIVFWVIYRIMSALIVKFFTDYNHEDHNRKERH
jgi:hypothetical protein